MEVVAGFHRRAENDHVDRDAALFANQGILDLDDEFTLLARQASRVRHIGHLAPNEVGPFVQQSVVELLIPLARGADVNVAVVDLGFRATVREPGGQTSASTCSTPWSSIRGNSRRGSRRSE